MLVVIFIQLSKVYYVEKTRLLLFLGIMYFIRMWVKHIQNKNVKK